ncbi:uncharacterized protein LOC122251693 [Penaeus japonicus]|uniref:uncharacterized protein LOC122251693 n=1 Tax=Penaeus japonicus TaxID=27405 RepID=UPI001C710BFF|nr:uncharacterized protein LOC122251693 [Penaeus japonicus]
MRIYKYEMKALREKRSRDSFPTSIIVYPCALKVTTTFLFLGVCTWALTSLFTPITERTASTSFMIRLQEDETKNGPRVMIPKEERLQDSTFSIATQGYAIPNCDCVRFGLKIDDIKRAQRETRAGNIKPPHWFRSNYTFQGDSTCSDYATQRGSGQKVFAYSFYSPKVYTEKESHFARYLGHLYSHISSIRTQYPGWVMRVYHNTSQEDAIVNPMFCRLSCAFQHVDFCHVKYLPNHLDLMEKGVVGRLWRFAVMGDPTVSTFLVRDTDSMIIERQIMAVQEWLASGKGFHVMRDHPNHHAIMLAGLWGGHNRNLSLLRKVRDDIFAHPTNLTTKFDQYMLATKLWPHIKDDVLQHDSYNCLQSGHEGSVPFPVKRVDGLYCGWGPTKLRERKVVLDTRCPVECRPKGHLDWNHC